MSGAADNFTSVTENTLSASNTFTDGITVTAGVFSIAVSGTFVGNVTLQLQPVTRDITQAWIDETTYTGPNVQISRTLPGQWRARAGFKAGNYTSGSAHISMFG